MFTVALLNAMGREGRGDRPTTEMVLMLAFVEFNTAERGRNRLMRWRRGEMSGHDFAREPGLGEQRNHRLGEMPLPVRPVHPLIGAKRSRGGPITFSRLPNISSSTEENQDERNGDPDLKQH